MKINFQYQFFNITMLTKDIIINIFSIQYLFFNKYFFFNPYLKSIKLLINNYILFKPIYN